MLEEIRKFISYWYFRYLLITELYMVEQWERVMIYIVLLIFFIAVSLVNHFVLLKCVASIFGNYCAPWIRLPALDLKNII